VSSDASEAADGPRACRGDPGRETAGTPGAEPSSRLGYLLKHAWQRLAELTTAALEPHGVDGRELAVLLTLADCEPASQQEAARSLGIDRTTMVALIDALEGRDLVARRPHAEDRRRNLVELTGKGRDTLRGAAAAGGEAERQFLAPLSEPAARQLKEALRAVLTPGPGPAGAGPGPPPGPS
jgi:DNA-binding MarR family transcriptional regulator